MGVNGNLPEAKKKKRFRCRNIWSRGNVGGPCTHACTHARPWGLLLSGETVDV